MSVAGSVVDKKRETIWEVENFEKKHGKKYLENFEFWEAENRNFLL